MPAIFFFLLSGTDRGNYPLESGAKARAAEDIPSISYHTHMIEFLIMLSERQRDESCFYMCERNGHPLPGYPSDTRKVSPPPNSVSLMKFLFLFFWISKSLMKLFGGNSKL